MRDRGVDIPKDSDNQRARSMRGCSNSERVVCDENVELRWRVGVGGGRPRKKCSAIVSGKRLSCVERTSIEAESNFHVKIKVQLRGFRKVHLARRKA